MQNCFIWRRLTNLAWVNHHVVQTQTFVSVSQQPNFTNKCDLAIFISNNKTHILLQCICLCLCVKQAIRLGHVLNFCPTDEGTGGKHGWLIVICRYRQTTHLLHVEVFEAPVFTTVLIYKSNDTSCGIGEWMTLKTSAVWLMPRLKMKITPIIALQNTEMISREGFLVDRSCVIHPALVSPPPPPPSALSLCVCVWVCVTSWHLCVGVDQGTGAGATSEGLF